MSRGEIALATIRLLNNVLVQGTFTALGTVALVGNFNFAGATITGLVVTGATFVNATLSGVTTINGTSLTVNAPTTFTNTVAMSGALTVTGPATFTAPITSNGLTLVPQATDPGAGTTIWVNSADPTHPSFGAFPLALESDVLQTLLVPLTTTANPWSLTAQFTVLARFVILGNATVVITLAPISMDPVQDSNVVFQDLPLTYAPTTSPTSGTVLVFEDGDFVLGYGRFQTLLASVQLTIGPLQGLFGPVLPTPCGWTDYITFTYNLNI
jgi:hypothetical protein